MTTMILLALLLVAIAAAGYFAQRADEAVFQRDTAESYAAALHTENDRLEETLVIRAKVSNDWRDLSETQLETLQKMTRSIRDHLDWLADVRTKAVRLDEETLGPCYITSQSEWITAEKKLTQWV